MTARWIVVGDVHGCIQELTDLLEACSASPSDKIVFVGDLVGKGPDSAGVVALARSLRALCVRGNHDERLIRWHELVAQAGATPVPPLGPAHRPASETLTEDDWTWLMSLPYYLRLPRIETSDNTAIDAIVVHAGLVPGVPLERQDPSDMIRMRSIREDGTASWRGDDGKSWASQWPGPELVLFGHDAVRGLQQHPHAIGLDTGCVYGKALTAYLLPDRRFVSVPAHKAWAPIGD